ncbi:uncharacterized protein YbgA (DUF1722 family) [Salsuginibacillus halophilus]|uniref:Uncharacterized protein YbgA (DUF1722 family) n=1 Tax=Salsuginibacillus halophilus TaxID=517424 RepID=A0A2P8HHR7_9BACI|nr:DUF1722 domain-containing protein [Salsuginibacillus halophilus]PSL45772.1 uncharacterized protein YbgA (DUF1722 family) [Salsuginibacillus halophilus]
MEKLTNERAVRKALEPFWASYKYEVMARGYRHYKQLSVRLNETPLSVRLFYNDLRTILGQPYSTKGMHTTWEHIWGYFKKETSHDEKAYFFQLLERGLQESPPRFYVWPPALCDLRHFTYNTLLVRYPRPYLEATRLFAPTEKWNEWEWKGKLLALTPTGVYSLGNES